MNLLALETSTEWCSAALWLDGQVHAREILAGQSHSERLLPMVDGLLDEAGIGFEALQAIAFGCGPGSFTGLRIACGVAQGLAFPRELPVVGVSTLLAMAEASAGARVVSCLDARIGEVYCAVYRREQGEWRCAHEPVLCKPDEVPPVEGEGWIGVGSGFAAHGEVLAARFDGRLDAIRSDLHPSAREIAVVGAQMHAQGLAVRPEEARPLYLRDRVALTVAERERLRAARNQNASGGRA
ncbi:MAG TPA: tRNA (adenosine(37)-N6)-threonylcarbamoyltransferase complex dimerization subunit type 1 TsaB [Burkholderiales bacterium]|nr:tRNA (adenosine(37)-N6)-threonylcarbamoyltransferase complex dimerization subunit type 1 TsaB [Burkholderiales bacterium]